jgi:esterase/lipase superfamily enzyme
VVGAVNGVAANGHWVRPVGAFPAQRGDAGEFECGGMVEAVGELLAAARHLPRFC